MIRTRAHASMTEKLSKRFFVYAEKRVSLLFICYICDIKISFCVGLNEDDAARMREIPGSLDERHLLRLSPFFGHLSHNAS